MSIPEPRTTTVVTVPEVTVRARVGVTLHRAGGQRAELVTFSGLPDAAEHLAIILGEPAQSAPVVRLHSECLTGDVLGSARCDCGPQLEESLRRIAEDGGAVLYLRQEGRGIGLYNKLDTYLLQDRGADTFEANQLIGREADERSYGVAASMLGALGMHRVRLLTNNPHKVTQLRECGIDVADVIPTGVHRTAENTRYLEAKALRQGHTIAVRGTP
ncbi:GTP cyclohydrolase II [Streptomyces sp. NPDC002144]|uniref:GTP cyclohydrolase II n=1 Tax=Streptomyces sp. NPDC006668 TaxID=3156903 RepID=UPI0033FA4289